MRNIFANFFFFKSLHIFLSSGGTFKEPHNNCANGENHVSNYITVPGLWEISEIKKEEKNRGRAEILVCL